MKKCSYICLSQNFRETKISKNGFIFAARGLFNCYLQDYTLGLALTSGLAHIILKSHQYNKNIYIYSIHLAVILQLLMIVLEFPITKAFTQDYQIFKTHSYCILSIYTINKSALFLRGIHSIFEESFFYLFSTMFHKISIPGFISLARLRRKLIQSFLPNSLAC